MSETSTLISCTGKITREELEKLPTSLETGFQVEHAHLQLGFGTRTPTDSGWHARSDCEYSSATTSRSAVTTLRLGETLKALLA